MRNFQREQFPAVLPIPEGVDHDRIMVSGTALDFETGSYVIRPSVDLEKFPAILPVRDTTRHRVMLTGIALDLETEMHRHRLEPNLMLPPQPVESGAPEAEVSLPISFADNRIQVYPDEHIVFVDDQERDFNTKERGLLTTLGSHAGTEVSHMQLCHEVWNTDLGHGVRAVHTRIDTVRAKLGYDDLGNRKTGCIRNIYGRGYYVEP